MFLVGHTKKRTLCRTGGIHDSFKLKRRDDVGMLGVLEFVELGYVRNLEARCDNDCAILFFDDLVLLIELDRTSRADLFAKSALAGLEVKASCRVDNGNVRHGLSKRNIDRTPVVKVAVKFVSALS